MMAEQFWTTLGYAAAGSDRRLYSFMSNPHTLLIDLRLDPHTEYEQWDSHALRRAWGKRYRQAGAYLGNVNHADSGPMSIPRLQEGLEVLLRYVCEGYSLVLLCGCMNLPECHREVVRREFEQVLQASQVDIPYVIEDTPEAGYINCLSIKQPWCSIIARSHLFQALDQWPKDVECRSWTTPWRGKLALHAGSTFDKGLFTNKIIDPIYWQDWLGTLAVSVIPVHKDQYPLGAIIALADLDVVLNPDVQELLDNPWYVEGQYAFVLKNIEPIDPIPWRGQRRIFQVPLSVFSEQGEAVIYVDEISEYTTDLPYKLWCHMGTSGTLDDLHAMAAQLGLKPEWFQDKKRYPHYDLTPLKREQAIQLGAVPVSSRVLLEKCWPDLLAKKESL